MRRRARAAARAAFCVVAASAALAAGGGVRAQDDARILPARVSADLTVEGRCRADRDVVVEPGATLRFRAGTIVEFASRDAARGGDFPDRCEIVVRGRIAVDGTPDEPVVFDGGGDADPAAPVGRRWHGITFHGERSRTPDSVITHARFRGAAEAVRVQDGNPRIENCVFDSCRIGVAAGALWNDRNQVVEEARRPRPDVVGCLFTRCVSGVFVEARASPEVRRSSFLRNGTAIGNLRNAHFTSPMLGLGVRADRCYFAANDVAVEAASVVENSVFVGNAVVFRASAFHAKYSQETDWLAWRRNVIHDNGIITDGESDIGGDNFHVDPGLRAPPTSAPPFDRIRLPLDGLDLLPDSALLRSATDGGDPGPSGAAPPGRRRRVWASANRALATLLVLGPPERVDTKLLPRAAPATAGERVGDAWWVAVDVGADGCVDRAVFARAGDGAAVAIAAVWAPGAGATPETIEINADGRIAVWRGGASLPFSSDVRRSGSRGERRALPPQGPPGAVVWWRPADGEPRLGIALPDGARARDAIVAPGDTAAALDAEAIRYGPRQAGLRIRSPFHWIDLQRSGTLVVRLADGRTFDAVELGAVVADGKGTVRLDLPSDAPKAGAVFVVDGLRDPWGRPLWNQPLEIPVEPK